MSVVDVRLKWPVYRDLVTVLFAALNGKIKLEGPDSPVRPFPKEEPERWSDWTTAAFNHIDAARELELADQAFRSIAAMLAASEAVATKVVVRSPSVDEVKSVQDGLEVINASVKADGRFHAALEIGTALAGNIKERMAA